MIDPDLMLGLMFVIGGSLAALIFIIYEIIEWRERRATPFTVPMFDVEVIKAERRRQKELEAAESAKDDIFFQRYKEYIDGL